MEKLEMNVNPLAVFEGLYGSGINFTISSFWNSGYYVSLGLEPVLLGVGEVKADTATVVSTLPEAAAWLDEKARKLYPESKYALGEEGFRRAHAEWYGGADPA